MKSKWIIALVGFENLRIDPNGNIWKLPFTQKDGKKRGVKMLKKDSKKKRWDLQVNGRREKWSENQLRPHIFFDKNPIVLINSEDETPW